MAKPTFVFVNGAWHPQEFFRKVIAILEKEGYKCVIVCMPGIGGVPGVENLDADIAAVRTAVMKELDMGNDVITHAHSWGGVPTCSALDGLSKAEREENGKANSVIRLTFVSAFVLPEGMSLADSNAQAGSPRVPFAMIKDGTVMRTDFLEAMYHDLQPEEAAYWLSMLKPHAIATFTDKARSAAWRKIPSSYLVCEDDRAIPVHQQDEMIAHIKESGGDIEVERLFVSHSPYIAKPAETALFLGNAAQRSVGA